MWSEGVVNEHVIVALLVLVLLAVVLLMWVWFVCDFTLTLLFPLG